MSIRAGSPVSLSVAFLRAVNVGGRTVTMARLVEVFRSLGYQHVETFLASGNVIFATPTGDRSRVEGRIEAALGKALQYDVPVFVRSLDEVAAIAAHEAFGAADIATAGTFNVAFVDGPLDQAARAKVAALETDLDRFHVRGSEIYWLGRLKQNASKFSNVALEKAIGRPTTMRGLSTVRRLAAKYGLSG